MVTPAAHDNSADPRPGAPGGGIELAPGVVVPESAVEFSFSRSGGPGGQNVNKLSTRCQLRVAVGAVPIHPEARQRLREQGSRWLTAGDELVIDCESERSQSGNKAGCLAKLRELIVRARVRPKTRRATRPTRGSIERRINEKKRAGERKARRRGGDGD